MAVPVAIGDRIFRTKKEAGDECRRILYGQELGTAIIDPAWHEFLDDLLLLHPDVEGKTGVGILRFEVRQNPKYPRQRSFYLVRTDGTETDFSFLVCLTEPTVSGSVLAAMRRAIAPQTIAVARAAFASGQPVPCALTGELLHAYTDAHVDHSAPTFHQLATTFVNSVGGWEAIPLHRADGQIGVQLADQGQHDAWAAYHLQHANLRVVSINANLSLLTRGARRIQSGQRR